MKRCNIFRYLIDNELDRSFDLIVAIRCLCADYHSGQWSRGYRIYSRIESRYKPQRIPISRNDLKSDDWERAAEIYDMLEETYKNKL